MYCTPLIRSHLFSAAGGGGLKRFFSVVINFFLIIFNRSLNRLICDITAVISSVEVN